MRLINTETLELEEFIGDEVPPYVIISHTWGKEEVSFQEYTWLTEHNKNNNLKLPENADQALAELVRGLLQNVDAKAKAIRQKAGYRKIRGGVAAAIKRCPTTKARKGCSYVWIDTCCIDRSSSAELSEAINSMCRWYRDAELCLVHLSDVSQRQIKESVGDRYSEKFNAALKAAFKRSRWFTRGWTLQELLGPRRLYFYDRDWGFIGDRQIVTWDIIEASGIPFYALRRSCFRGEGRGGGGGGGTEEFCVAKRMSWASKRQTTRKEDAAYSLLGIFDLNMPLLYGEGEKAFLRLQREILLNNARADYSILAWGYALPLRDMSRLSNPGALAASPSLFRDCGLRSSMRSRSSASGYGYLEWTTRGISTNLVVLEAPDAQTEVSYAILPGVLDASNNEIAIPLRYVGHTAPTPSAAAHPRSRHRASSRSTITSSSSTSTSSYEGGELIYERIAYAPPVAFTGTMTARFEQPVLITNHAASLSPAVQFTDNNDHPPPAGRFDLLLDGDDTGAGYAPQTYDYGDDACPLELVETWPPWRADHAVQKAGRGDPAVNLDVWESAPHRDQETILLRFKGPDVVVNKFVSPSRTAPLQLVVVVERGRGRGGDPAAPPVVSVDDWTIWSGWAQVDKVGSQGPFKRPASLAEAVYLGIDDVVKQGGERIEGRLALELDERVLDFRAHLESARTAYGAETWRLRLSSMRQEEVTEGVNPYRRCYRRAR